MLRIIHLSDLHIHKANSKADNKNAFVLCDHLKARYGGDRAAKTYVVMTGDLVDDADRRQYRNLRDRVLKPLREDFEVLCAPGNHDYAKWGNIFQDSGPANFREYVRDIPFPHPDRVEGEGVSFIALDSADPLDKKWFAEGVIDQNQRDGLDQVLTECEDDFKVVYLHHHPFYRDTFVALRDWRELLAVMSGRVDLVLFGHRHRSEAFFGWYDVDMLLASRKVTESAGNGLAYRVIEIESKSIVDIRTEEIKAAK